MYRYNLFRNVLLYYHLTLNVYCSLALSIKMNVLLYFPAFGMLMWQSVGAWKTLLELAIIAGIQVREIMNQYLMQKPIDNVLQISIATPFLKLFPASYLKRSFEFGRVFDYKWTVNWRMVDAKTFVSTEFANALLLGHIVTLLFFTVVVWSKR